MTESEWLTTTDPSAMLAFFEGRASERKLRLFAVACCRRVPRFLLDVRHRNALNKVERYADGQINSEELWEAAFMGLPYPFQGVSQAMIVPGPIGWRIPAVIFHGRINEIVRIANELANSVMAEVKDSHAGLRARPGEEIETAQVAWKLAQLVKRLEQLLQCCLLRDIFGNPFQGARAAPFQVNGSALALARRIYEEPAFDQLPLLADALEAAGCDNADLVNHCREPGLHVRGCWVVDLLLGKQ
jgi:hypothetical protein